MAKIVEYCPTCNGLLGSMARIEELEAECNDLAHQLNQCNERGGHIIAENRRLRSVLSYLASHAWDDDDKATAEEALREGE